jgi:hypothetical protein
MKKQQRSAESKVKYERSNKGGLNPNPSRPYRDERKSIFLFLKLFSNLFKDRRLRFSKYLCYNLEYITKGN